MLIFLKYIYSNELSRGLDFLSFYDFLGAQQVVVLSFNTVKFDRYSQTKNCIFFLLFK